MGTYLLERGLSTRYMSMGARKEGSGGLYEQVNEQGLGPDDVVAAIRKVAGK
jgi:hypothetical protein